MRWLAGIASALLLIAAGCSDGEDEPEESSPYCVEVARLVEADIGLGEADTGMVTDAAGVEWRYAAGLLRVRAFSDLTLSSEQGKAMVNASLVLERLDTSLLAIGSYDDEVHEAAATLVQLTSEHCESVRFDESGFICSFLTSCPQPL